jgi:hypothetical protein
VPHDGLDFSQKRAWPDGRAVSHCRSHPRRSGDRVRREDAQFLEWERMADHWWAVAGAKDHTDEETDAHADLHARFEGLIFETPSTSPVAARVKARAMLR